MNDENTSALESAPTPTTEDAPVIASDANETSQAQLRLQLDEARHELALERQRAADEREKTYVGVVDRLISQGRLLPADRPGLLDAGTTAGHRLSLLAPFERLPASAALPTSGVARRFASPAEPNLGASGPLSDERIKQIAADW